MIPVVAGSERSYGAVCPCNSPTEDRRFRMLVVRIGDPGDGNVLVIHRRLEAAAAETVPAGEEIVRRWSGVSTICPWCGEAVRDGLGRWTPGARIPGITYSHGLCPRCDALLLPPEPRPV